MAEVEEILCSVKTQRNRKPNFSVAEEEMLQHEVGKHLGCGSFQTTSQFIRQVIDSFSTKAKPLSQLLITVVHGQRVCSSKMSIVSHSWHIKYSIGGHI
jgi:hypothetical protein